MVASHKRQIMVYLRVVSAQTTCRVACTPCSHLIGHYILMWGFLWTFLWLQSPLVHYRVLQALMAYSSSLLCLSVCPDGRFMRDTPRAFRSNNLFFSMDTLYGGKQREGDAKEGGLHTEEYHNNDRNGLRLSNEISFLKGINDKITSFIWKMSSVIH